MNKHTPELTRYRCAQYPPCDGWVVKYGTLCPACARLIAAAPELLAALGKISLTTEPEYLLEVAGHIRGHCESCDWYADNLTELQQTQRVARAIASTAIAKATGTEST